MTDAIVITEAQFAEITAWLDHANRMREESKAPHLTLKQKLVLIRMSDEAMEKARAIGVKP